MTNQKNSPLTYAEALKIAFKLKPNIDNCRENTDAYVFGSHADDCSIGCDGPVVIIKETGRAINMTDYLGDFSGTFVKEIKI